MGGWRGDRQKVVLGALGLGLVGREALARLREADLRGEVAFVTGGSRGLGLLIARELGRVGCRVAICARDEAELGRAGQDLERRGVEVLTLVCDVGDREAVEEAVDRATRHFGRIDVLVNNAGVIQVGPLGAMTVEDFEHAMDVIYWGAVYATLAVLPQMRRRGTGRIVNVTSVGGKVSVPHLLPYAAAKFAAVGLSEGLRSELARDGITVTTIVPGLMRTGSGLNALFKGNQDREFGLFASVASLPIISMDAENAARQIVQATRRGEAERILGLPANLIARLQGLLPGLNADLMGLVNRLLPTGGPESGTARGMDVHRRTRSPLLDGLTRWNLDAARRFNEHPGPTDVADRGPARERGRNAQATRGQSM
jgi:NAD(P)-dependent dehydrogenase (short-subunit alcohol dehydrogenase family)